MSRPQPEPAVEIVPSEQAGQRRDTPKPETFAERRVAGMGLDLQAMATVSNVHRVAMRLRRHFEQGVLRESRLTWTGFVTLWVLWVRGAMETRWLAQEVDVNRSTLSGVLNTLERRGLLQRRGHGSDARLVLAELTSAGEALIADLFPRFNAEQSVVVSPVSPTAHGHLADALRAIEQMLETEDVASAASEQM